MSPVTDPTALGQEPRRIGLPPRWAGTQNAVAGNPNPADAAGPQRREHTGLIQNADTSLGMPLANTFKNLTANTGIL